MTIQKRLLLFPLLILLNALPVFAGPQHGLSLYGPEGLKYKADEPYEYANPKAPKGGHLVLSDFGAFTKLNPVIVKRGDRARHLGFGISNADGQFFR